MGEESLHWGIPQSSCPEPLSAVKNSQHKWNLRSYERYGAGQGDVVFHVESWDREEAVVQRKETWLRREVQTMGPYQLMS